MKFKLKTLAYLYSPESAKKYETYGFEFISTDTRLMAITEDEPEYEVNSLNDILVMQAGLGDLLITGDSIIIVDRPIGV